MKTCRTSGVTSPVVVCAVDSDESQRDGGEIRNHRPRFLLAVALVTYVAAVVGSVVCRCVTRRLTDRVCLQRYSDF